MGLFGGGGGVKLTDKSKGANDYLLGALDPSNPNWQKYGVDTGGVEFGSILTGVPGVGSFSSEGNYVEPGNRDLPTTLPGIQTIADYDTLLGQYDAGQLSPTANRLIGGFADMATGGTDAIKSLLGSIGGAGGVGGGGGGISKPSTPVFNAPANIGELTSEILSSMPPEFQEFTKNVLDAADPEAFEAELQNFEDKMTAKMFADIDEAGEQVLDVFASQGLGTAGAAIAASKELAIRGVIETNAIIASERMKSLQIYTDRLQTGNQLMNILLSAGAEEQANLVAGEVARMNAQAQTEMAYMNAQAQLQAAAMQAHTAQMSILAGAAVDMFRTQAGLAESAFQGLLAENTQKETLEDSAYMLPYQVLGGLTGQNKQSGQSGGLDVGGLLGGAASLIGVL